MQSAMALHRAGRFDEAMKCYDGILDLYPDHPDVLSNSALLVSRLGDHEDASARLRKAAVLAPAQAGLHNNLGMVLEAGGMLSEAEASLGRAIQLDPGLTEAHCNLGNVQQKQGEFGKAADCYRTALALAPDNAVTHNNLGNALMAAGHVDAAMASFRTAIGFAPGSAEILNNMGILYMRLGAGADAIGSFRAAIDAEPGFANAYYNLGNTLSESGDSEGAITAYGQCLQANPNHANACVNWSKLLLDEGRLREAVDQLGAEVERNASNPTVLAIYSALLADGSDLDLALSSGLKAYLMDDNAAATVCATSKAFVEKGLYADAASIYEKLPAPVTEHDVVAHGWLVESLLRHQRKTAARPLIDFMLDHADLSARQRHRYLVTNAIHCWLGNDVAGCDGFIAKASEVSVVTGGQNLDRNLYVYETYLAALLEYRRQHAALYQKEEAEPLHIIGESHCLSPHGVAVQIGEADFRMQGHMILGCKAWHLADPTVNHYQRSYWAAASGLPSGANVLTAIGEIDCRPDEGIYPLHRKRGGDLADIIGRTVDGFVDFVALVGDNQRLNMNICGVPAPNRARSGEFPLPDQQMASYLDVVARFNGALEAAATRRGCGFVDLYGLTVGEDKVSDGSHHLDNTHLLPAVVQQAIARA
jgi:tetratricopeptide (TPR) repeat protein